MDYYSYHPTVFMERPVCLAGFFGLELGVIAGIISQRTGIAVVELDRWIEHDAGKSVSELVLFGGEKELRRREVPLLRRALADTPPPLIALSDATLTEYDARRMVLKGAKLIYLKSSLEDLFERVCYALQASPGCYWPWTLQGPSKPEDLRSLLDDRRGGYESAHVVIDVTGLHPNTIAEQVLAEIQK